jgi:DNA adenine methylase
MSPGGSDKLPPLFRWAGSKRQVVETLARAWPGNQHRYVEPFAGSACLFFHLRPTAALLADINPELVTTYCVLADDPDGVHRVLETFGPASRDTYYVLRAQDPHRLSPTGRAARFVYLNRFCFNGLYRTDRTGRFNVPYGGAKSGSLPDQVTLRTYGIALRSAELRAADFDETIAEVQAGDFVYLDPPYAVATQWRRGRHYTEEAFAVDDVHRLIQALRSIADTGATFLLSYADSPEGHTIRDGWNWIPMTVRRSIAGSAFKRVHQQELLISNLPLLGREAIA